jgi:hypothetical protein
LLVMPELSPGPAVDAKSGQEKMYYLGFSFLTAALPMGTVAMMRVPARAATRPVWACSRRLHCATGLYYSILDLDLGSATNLAAAVLGMGGAMYALCSFYHDMTGTKKHDYHNHVRVNGATKKKEGKEEADERDRVIAKRALMWSLFYNNLCAASILSPRLPASACLLTVTAVWSQGYSHRV